MSKEARIKMWEKERYNSNWVIQDYHVRAYYAYQLWYDVHWGNQIEHCCDYQEHLQMKQDEEYGLPCF